MGSTSKLCEIADAGPLVHTMSWEEIGKACGDASLRIAQLEAALERAAGVIGQMHKTILHSQGIKATQPNGEEVLARAALSKST